MTLKTLILIVLGFVATFSVAFLAFRILPLMIGGPS